MNQHSNHEITFFLPIVTAPMNIMKPLGFTGVLPNADISKVRTRFDDFSDSIIRIIIVKNAAAQLVIQNYCNNPFVPTFTQ